MKIKRISAYKLVYGRDISDLEFEVNALIKEGWQPISKIMIKDYEYYLEMGIPSKNENSD